MAVSAMTKLLQHPLNPNEVRAVLREAAHEAYRRNYTYTEAIFQLGQRAEALGLDEEIIESEIRDVFDGLRREQDFVGDSGTEVVAGSAKPTGEHLAVTKTLINRKRTSKFFNIESMEIPWPADHWRFDLSRLLKSTFGEDEICQLLQNLDGKAKDTKVAEIHHHEKELVSLMKKFDGNGAYLRINPSLEGGRNLFRHILLEVKGIELGRQLSFFKIFNLPCSALVNCGGRTIQAWIRLDARSREEFDERSVFLVRVLRDLGFEVDVHSGNPMAPALMPGVMISGKQCYIVETDMGAPSFEEWKSWAEAYLDGDPLVESSTIYQESPPKNVEVVESLFRQGHRVLLAGPAYSGKSMTAIDLAVSISFGEDWNGFATEETPVLFVNVECESALFVSRAFEVAQAKGLSTGNENLDYLHVLGLNKNPRDFVEFLVHRIESMKKWESKRYATLIIDGLVDGLDGRGEEIGSALGLLLDRLVVHSGVAVVIVARNEDLKHLDPLVDTIIQLHPIQLPTGEAGADFQIRGRFLKNKISKQYHWNYPIFQKA